MMSLFAGTGSPLGIIEHLKDVLTIIRCKVSILWSAGFLAPRPDDPLIVAGYLDSSAAGRHRLLCWHYHHQEHRQDRLLFFVAGVSSRGERCEIGAWYQGIRTRMTKALHVWFCLKQRMLCFNHPCEISWHQHVFGCPRPGQLSASCLLPGWRVVTRCDESWQCSWHRVTCHGRHVTTVTLSPHWLSGPSDLVTRPRV